MFQLRCPIKTSPAEFYVSKDSSAGVVFFQLQLYPSFFRRHGRSSAVERKSGRSEQHILTGCPVYDIMRSNRHQFRKDRSMNIYDTLNEQQKEAVFCTEGPLLLLAGAGFRENEGIDRPIAYLIQECGVNPYHILAITFTNKAAAEMREAVDDLVGYGAEHIWVSTFHSAVYVF